MLLLLQAVFCSIFAENYGPHGPQLIDDVIYTRASARYWREMGLVIDDSMIEDSGNEEDDRQSLKTERIVLLYQCVM